MLAMLTATTDACATYRAEWQNLIAVVQEWGVSPYNLKRSFFDIIHMGMRCATRMDAYMMFFNDEGEPLLPPDEFV